MVVGYWVLHDKLDTSVTEWGKKTDGTEAPGKGTTGKETAEKKPPAESQPSATTKPPTTTPPASADKTDSPKRSDAEIMGQRRRIDRAAGAAESTLVTVYYADGLKAGESLTPVEIRVPRSLSPIQEVTKQVINAPNELKLYSNFPAGVQVKSVNIHRETGIATVDLSAQASDVQGSASAAVMRAALVYSLTEFKEVKAVQLWVNGRTAVLHGIAWDQPISRLDLEQRQEFKIEPVIKYQK